MSLAAPFYSVLNAGSGHGGTATTCQTIATVLNAAGRAHKILRVENPDQLGEIAKQAVVSAQQHGGIVVAAGGDGTLNAVAQVTLSRGCQSGSVSAITRSIFQLLGCL